MYQLTDMFSLFYLRFVNKNAGIDDHFWTNIGKTGKNKSKPSANLVFTRVYG